MNIISNINLNDSNDRRARNMQDTADIFEFSSVIQLKRIYDSIEAYDNAVTYNIANGRYSLTGNTGVARQALINNFDINQAKVFEDYNAYRDVFLAHGTNIDIPNTTPGISPIAFPPKFIILNDTGSQLTNITTTQNGTDGVHRRLVATVAAKYRNTIGDETRNIRIRVYDSYIKQADNHIIYYRWLHYIETDNITTIKYVGLSYDGTEIEDEVFTAPVTFLDDGDWIVLNNHGFTVGTKIKFSSIVGTTGISENTVYTVGTDNILDVETNRFKIRNSLGQTVQFNNDGTGTLIYDRSALVSFLGITASDLIGL